MLNDLLVGAIAVLLFRPRPHHRPLRSAAARVVLSALLVASCSSSPTETNQKPGPIVTPVGNPVSVDIGPAGGTIATSDGAISLVIPAGALASSTAVTIQPIVNTAPNSYGMAYQVKPSGLALAKPATITMAIAESDLDGQAPEGLGIGELDSTGTWRADLSSTADVPAVASAEYAHGSQSANNVPIVLTSVTVTFPTPWAFAVASFWKVVPASATVAAGGTVPITIEACVTGDDLGDPNGGVLTASSACAPSVRQGTWYVNGAPGGDQTHGGVVALSPSSKALYTAPAVPPPGGVATVQAHMLWVQRGVTRIFTIPITIAPSPWSGKLTFTLSGDTSWVESTGATTNWTFTGGGTVDVKADSSQVTPNGATLFPTAIGATVLFTRHTHLQLVSGGCTVTTDEDERQGGNFVDLSPAPYGFGSVNITLRATDYIVVAVPVYFEIADTTITTTTTKCPGDPDKVDTKTTGQAMPGGGYLQVPPAPPIVPFGSPNPTSLTGSTDFPDLIRGGMKDRMEWSITIH